MKQAMMVICDQEESYALRLQDFLSEKKIPYGIRIFTKVKEFLHFYTQNQIEILLMAQSFYQADFSFEQIEHFYLLQEQEECHVESACCISKYQSAELIFKQVMMNSHLIKPTKEHGSSKTVLIGVYTPVKRSLQTSFSLVLGQLLAKKKKVLYLNFEAYSGFSAIVRKKYNHDLSDLLYTLRNAEDKLLQRLSSMVETVNNLDFIPPTSSILDLESTNGEELKKLLQAIVDYSFYDYIILDLSDSIQGLLNVLGICQKIYTLTKQDGVAMAKIEQYEKTIVLAKQENILAKTQKYNLPQFEKIPKYIEEFPYGALANYIKELVKEDFHGAL